MAYTPTQKDIDSIISNQGVYTPTQDDIDSILPKKQGMMGRIDSDIEGLGKGVVSQGKGFIGSMADNIVNMLNYPADAINAISAITHVHIPDIATHPESYPHNIGAIGGDIASFFLPVGGELKFLGMLGKAIPKVAKLAEKIPSFVKGGIITGGAGAAIAPTGQRTKQGFESAGAGVLGDLAGSAIKAIAKPLASRVLGEKYIPTVDETHAQQAFDSARENEAVHNSNASDEFDKLNSMFTDESGTKTDEYKQGIDDLKQKYPVTNVDGSANELKALTNSKAQTLLSRIGTADTSNINNLYDHYKDLNTVYSDLSKKITEPSAKEFSALNNARTLARNTIHSKGSPQLSAQFKKANKMYENKENLFGINDKGAKSAYAKVKTGQDKGFPYNATNFVNEFVPKKGEGIAKMQRFSKVVGDDTTAKNAIKSKIFAGLSTDKDQFTEFKKVYQNLSKDQQKYLFGDNSTDISKAFKDAKTPKTTFHTSMMGHILPDMESGILPMAGAIGGTLLGHHLGDSGLSAIAGGLLGVGAGSMANKGIYSTLSKSPYLTKQALKNAPSYIGATGASSLYQGFK